MIKGTLKTMEQFLGEGASFNKRGDLTLKSGCEISAQNFSMLGKQYEEIEFDPEDEIFDVDDKAGHKAFFTKEEFSNLEGLEELEEKTDFDQDNMKFYKFKNGLIQLVEKNSVDEKSYKDNSDWTDITAAF